MVINRLEDLPAEAEEERRLCLAKSMKSILSIPMVSGRRTLGSCALVAVRAERIWPEDLVQRMRLIAAVFAGALARKRSEESLRESEARLNLAATSAEAGLWILEIATGHIWATEKARELYGFAPDQELNFEEFHPDRRSRGSRSDSPERGAGHTDAGGFSGGIPHRTPGRHYQMDGRSWPPVFLIRQGSRSA